MTGDRWRRERRTDYVAPDPLNPEVIFGGSVARQDFHNEQVQQMPPTLDASWRIPADVDTAAGVFCRLTRMCFISASQVLFRTADGGSSWQKISPDLTREDPGAPANLDAATAADAPAAKRRGVIYTIAPSPMRAGEIWVGTDDGLVQLTRDEGKTWNNVTPPELTPWSKVTHIEASQFDAGTAYRGSGSPPAGRFAGLSLPNARISGRRGSAFRRGFRREVF